MRKRNTKRTGDMSVGFDHLNAEYHDMQAIFQDEATGGWVITDTANVIELGRLLNEAAEKVYQEWRSSTTVSEGHASVVEARKNIRR